MPINRRQFLLTAGGATRARYLKPRYPQVEVTPIEPRARFVSCPMANTVLAGWNRLDDLGFDCRSFESTEVPGAHLLGDAILSKAAALANNSGRLCVYALGLPRGYRFSNRV
jgi:hypothetical protein